MKRIDVVIEPEYRNSTWCLQTLDGIHRAAEAWRYTLRTYEGISGVDLSSFGSLLVLLGTTRAWLDGMVEQFLSAGRRVLVAGSSVNCQPSVSAIRLEYRTALRQVVYYLRACGRSQIALLGVNPAAPVDQEKEQGFLAAMAEFYPDVTPRVYLNRGSIEACVQQFLEQGYCDAAIGVNDVVCINVLKQLDNQYRPQQLYLTGFGDMILGQLCSPPLTTVTLNYTELGRQAVSLWEHLETHPEALSIECSVRCRILARGTTENQLAPAVPAHRQNDGMHYDNTFFRDPLVSQMLELEIFFQSIDDLDRSILHGLLIGRPYGSIAENLNVSDGTVKYRLKRMEALSGARDRDTLLTRLRGACSLTSLAGLLQDRNE